MKTIYDEMASMLTDITVMRADGTPDVTMVRIVYDKSHGCCFNEDRVATEGLGVILEDNDEVLTPSAIIHEEGPVTVLMRNVPTPPPENRPATCSKESTRTMRYRWALQAILNDCADYLDEDPRMCDVTAEQLLNSFAQTIVTSLPSVNIQAMRLPSTLTTPDDQNDTEGN